MQIPQVFASGTRAQESVFLCTVFPIRSPNHAPPGPGTPGPRRPGSKTTQRETAAKNGADPARQVTEAWSRERGAVELIGVLAQTGWVLMRPEGTPPGTR